MFAGRDWELLELNWPAAHGPRISHAGRLGLFGSPSLDTIFESNIKPFVYVQTILNPDRILNIRIRLYY